MQATRVAPRSQEWIQFNERVSLFSGKSNRGLPSTGHFRLQLSTRGTILLQSPAVHLQERHPR